jgi:phosphoglycolate phosphatase-like HAD superfamily hydrolase
MIKPNPDAKLWLFDFDNTLAALEREVDWPGSRRELEAYLRAEGVSQEIFAEIPKGNLPLYAALHTRWLLRAPLGQNAPASASASPSDPSQPADTNTLPRQPLGASNGTLRSPAGVNPEEAARDAFTPFADTEAVLRYASEIIERHELIGAERAAPTPGAIDLLKAIVARGALVIIVTSNSSRTVAHWLDRHDVSGLVRAIVGRDSLLALKPSPEMIARALALASRFTAAAPSTIPAAALAPIPSVGAFTTASTAGAPMTNPDSKAAISNANVAESRTAASTGKACPTMSADTDFVSVTPATELTVEAVFVGDSLADFEAARAAGLGFYGIATTESARDRLIAAGATEIFSSPAALQIHLNLTPSEPPWDSDSN